MSQKNNKLDQVGSKFPREVPGHHDTERENCTHTRLWWDAKYRYPGLASLTTRGAFAMDDVSGALGAYTTNHFFSLTANPKPTASKNESVSLRLRIVRIVSKACSRTRRRNFSTKWAALAVSHRCVAQGTDTEATLSAHVDQMEGIADPGAYQHLVHSRLFTAPVYGMLTLRSPPNTFVLVSNCACHERPRICEGKQQIRVTVVVRASNCTRRATVVLRCTTEILTRM
ncbi:hypothetical protein B0H13DRAFT_1888125 [Mycena leptocephala]|nr:hypothetical protein B0H13DRAFT_1888125 [Mycena leptocephala]